jgi:predicted phage terminase large subunit-like protein
MPRKINYTKEQLEYLGRLAQEEIYRRSFEEYLYMDGEGLWQTSRHIKLLCSYIEKVSDGELKRLIVTMPPRHSKSETISKKFPSWHIGKHPDDEMILASYSLDLARQFSRIARDTLIRHQDIFNVEIDKGNQSAESWTLQGHRGGLNAAGVGGPITGKGARIAIVDDPFKNREEANSEVIRQKVWDWYTSTFYTRLTPDGRIIIVMTRWHEDDLVGRLLEKEKKEILAGVHKGECWTVINLPALAEEHDILGREVGQPLWPEFGFDKQRLEEIKNDVGNYDFNALYQQRPAAQEGNMLKRAWWKYYKQAPSKFDEIVISWDMSFKDSDSSDYCAGGVYGRLKADKYMLDLVNDRMDFPTALKAVKQLKNKYPDGKILIEDKANGTAIIAMLRHEIPGIIPITPTESKIARVSAISPDVEAGNVYLPEDAAWTSDFINQCSSFPNATHDDMVDQFSQAMNRMKFHRRHDEYYELPDDLREDLKQDLLRDPKALKLFMEEWHRKNDGGK